MRDMEGARATGDEVLYCGGFGAQPLGSNGQGPRLSNQEVSSSQSPSGQVRLLGELGQVRLCAERAPDRGWHTVGTTQRVQ